ncbi:hypothetical protein IT399_02650 [Candidatus Nomurabacteria bacterium]|nr:hypothetical protein [Candidatus Nomurabacteria bacterium]
MINPENIYRKNDSPKEPGNINDWALALKDISESEDATLDQKIKLSSLARDISEPREYGLLKLEKMGLPKPKQILVSLVEFLQNPQEILQKFKTKKIYISLNPKTKYLPRHRTVILITDTENFIKEKLLGIDPKLYNVLAVEFLENIYGGSIVINPDGKILVEFRRGQQGPIASGTETPEFSVSRNIFNSSFKYSFEDPILRQEIYKTILKIPHEGEGRDMKFTPGYYEFALVRENKQVPMHPLFFDYKDDKNYYLP